jgi:alpha/beta superfamily hydrolase
VREEPQRIAGRLEGTLRVPDATPTAIVLIAHPLPTHGGTMRNPLMASLARAVAERGWYALRFNFRGVGESAGEWSGGLDEPADLAAAAEHARGIASGLPLGVIGFSFGSVTVLRWMAAGGRPDAYALLGVPLRSVSETSRELPPVPAGSLIVNGERDEFGTAAELRARYPEAEVVEVKGADHYFTGKRDELTRVVIDRLSEQLRLR